MLRLLAWRGSFEEQGLVFGTGTMMNLFFFPVFTPGLFDARKGWAVLFIYFSRSDSSGSSAVVCADNFVDADRSRAERRLPGGRRFRRALSQERAR